MLSRRINWGIIGTGKSAHNLAQALSMTKSGKLVAISSRKLINAKKFAQEFNLPLYFSSCKEFANNIEIDIVYIATPNSCHKEHALLCLEAGKNVLVEKPFTTNTKDAQILIDLAKKNNLFLMEAMWTRFTPAFIKVEQLIKSGEIGEIVSFQSSLGQPSEIDKSRNLFNGSMGGGATLDLGVYLVFWAHRLFGSPDHVQSSVHYGDTDVDLTSSAILSYGQGKYTHLSSSIISRFLNNGIIYGDKGFIEIRQPLYCPTAFSITKYSEINHFESRQSILRGLLSKIKRSHLLQNLYMNHPLLGRYILGVTTKRAIHMPIKGNGLQYMTEEVSRYLLGDKSTNGKIISLSETLATMKVVDKIRRTT